MPLGLKERFPEPTFRILPHSICRRKTRDLLAKIRPSRRRFRRRKASPNVVTPFCAIVGPSVSLQSVVSQRISLASLKLKREPFSISLERQGLLHRLSPPTKRSTVSKSPRRDDAKSTRVLFRLDYLFVGGLTRTATFITSIDRPYETQRERRCAFQKR